MLNNSEIQSALRHNDFWYSVKMRMFAKHGAESLNRIKLVG